MSRNKKIQEKSTKPLQEPLQEPVQEIVLDITPIEEPPITPTNESLQSSGRKTYSRDDIIMGFNDIITSCESLIESIRSDTKKCGVAHIRTLKNKIQSLQKKAIKLIKPKKNQSLNKRNNITSGFLKPINISPEMAKFTGFDSKVKYSRVDVTKFLCEYIKNHGLQNPSDRRQINLDPKLSKLLKYDSGKPPLTYFQLQSHLKHHFISDGMKKIAV